MNTPRQHDQSFRKFSFGTQVRKSPFSDAALRWGAQGFSVYNHMYIPRDFGDPVQNFWNLVNDAILCDVAVERQVEITGPDAARFTQFLSCRDLSKCEVGQCKYVLITDQDGGIINDPILLKLAEDHFWLSIADSDVLLWARGVAATFRATGQTGILIAGGGIPMDAVVSDFLSGAAEILTPDAAPDHWDVIEGQGSLFHPAYAAVTLGLLHGSQPDAMVLCHAMGRTAIDEYEDYPVPDLRECIAQYEQAARVTNAQARVAGISLNTQGCDDASSLSACNEISSLTGVPCIDPMRHALDPILDALPG